MQPKQMSEGEKRDQAAMKSWLAFLPEIKQEIQAFLELPENKKLPPGRHYAELSPFLELTTNRMSFSRLQECLSRLDKFPNIQEILNEADTKRLGLIFREFQLVKLRARVAILTIRTNIEQVAEDHGSDIHSWAVNILPSFYVPARISVSCKEDHYRIVFAVSLSEESISTSVMHMNLPRSWADPLEKPLRQLNLFQSENQLSLDGIEYELACLSRTSKSVIYFGNPSIPTLIEIEKAFFSIAEMIVNQKGQQAEKNYLAEWHRYLAR